MPSRTDLAIGLMSGTSADGVDAALIRTDGGAHIEFLAAVTLPYDDLLRGELLHAAQLDVPLEQLLRLESALTDAHAMAVQHLLSDASEVPAVIGFHGHTIRHLPALGCSWQMGNAARLAERTGLPVVSDFRRQDLAAGGQGAPLVPLYHAALWGDRPRPVAILNLGGVANVTLLTVDGQILAGDTGPGCGRLDAWVEATSGQRCDWGGQLALAGQVDEGIVAESLRLPYFQRPFPKSADRFDFEAISVAHLTPADGAATLCAVTADAVADAVADALQRIGSPLPALWVTGGGSHHPVIMSRLRHHFPRVEDVRQLGWRPDSLEAECFAWLAIRVLDGQPTTLPSTTGCAHPTCGGQFTRGRARGDATSWRSGC